MLYISIYHILGDSCINPEKTNHIFKQREESSPVHLSVNISKHQPNYVSMLMTHSIHLSEKSGNSIKVIADIVEVILPTISQKSRVDVAVVRWHRSCLVLCL